jgi:hypothetical protein
MDGARDAVGGASKAAMPRFHPRTLSKVGPEPVTSETQPSPPRPLGDEDERRNRQALVEYFGLLQEWSLKAQPEGSVSEPRVISGAAAKGRKRR